MKEEKSCGVVLYKKDNGVKFLVLKYDAGHWGFPKGHMEEGEGEKETARRETREETGISNLQFVEGFREVINYKYKRKGELRSKKVIFFLAETKKDKVELSHEHKKYAWLEYDEAKERLTYKDTVKLLKKARKFLKKENLTQYF